MQNVNIYHMYILKFKNINEIMNVLNSYRIIESVYRSFLLKID